MYLRIMMLSAELVTSIDRSVPLSERLSMGFKTLMLGMTIVLLVFAFLWGLLELFKYIFYDLPNNKTKNTSEHNNSTNEPARIVQEEVDDSSAWSESNLSDLTEDEIIAAITAAIAVYRDIDTTAYQGGFRVVSFRRSKTDRWQ